VSPIVALELADHADDRFGLRQSALAVRRQADIAQVALEQAASAEIAFPAWRFRFETAACVVRIFSAASEKPAQARATTHEGLKKFEISTRLGSTIRFASVRFASIRLASIRLARSGPLKSASSTCEWLLRDACVAHRPPTACLFRENAAIAMMSTTRPRGALHSGLIPGHDVSRLTLGIGETATHDYAEQPEGG